MKLSNEVVEELVKELVGSKVIPLVRLVKEKGNISEFKLADKLKLTVNQVRSLLYELSAYSLVSFTRKKDKKKGWYNYFWSFRDRRAWELILGMKKERIGILKKRLNVEYSDLFFKCPSGCIRMTLENAMEVNFKCPECGLVLQEQKTHVNVETVNKEISKLEQEIEELERIAVLEEEKARRKAMKKVKKKVKKRKGVKKKKKVKKKPKKKKKFRPKKKRFKPKKKREKVRKIKKKKKIKKWKKLKKKRFKPKKKKIKIRKKKPKPKKIQRSKKAKKRKFTFRKLKKALKR